MSQSGRAEGSGRGSGGAMSRAEFLRISAGAVALAFGAGALAQAGTQGVTTAAPVTKKSAARASAMLTRKIPASGEPLPVIGLGTWRGFDAAAGTPEYRRLPAVIAALFAEGGSVIDSSPMYGRAEAVAGELLSAAGTRDKSFLATKVWTRGRERGLDQMNDSFRLLQTPVVDLMQVHNLLDWRTQIPSLRELKAAGKIRYLGVTHYTAGAYEELEAVMKIESLDFLQINYSFDEREAEKRVLPIAQDRGMAVLINRPFGGGGLLRRLSERPLPGWAAEIGATSWAQLLLKFVLSHPGVTCAIPGTSRPEHMIDNARAGSGVMPDARFWRAHPELFA